jgi:hypothetical protein
MTSLGPWRRTPRCSECGNAASVVFWRFEFDVEKYVAEMKKVEERGFHDREAANPSGDFLCAEHSEAAFESALEAGFCAVSDPARRTWRYWLITRPRVMRMELRRVKWFCKERITVMQARAVL